MKKIISSLFIFLVVCFACQPDDIGNDEPGTDPNNPSLPQEEDVVVETSGIEINPDAKPVLADEWMQNISVLDSTNFNLQVNETLIQKYKLQAGSILVSDRGDGLLRKIKSIGTAANGKAVVETEFSASFKENGVMDINGRTGTWSQTGSNMTISWIARKSRPPGCTYQLKGTINGATCSGSYIHWDYDAKNIQSVWDSGTFTGYIESASH
jgi:hypothetical protein